MDNNNLNNDGVVGVDPTFVETVESLDVLPPSMQPKEPDNNNPSTGKKILFAILIIVLMAGVAFGVWYYLNLGNSEKVKPEVNLHTIMILVGEELSKNVADYGTFKGVNPESCSINLLNVKNDAEGEYPYTVTCGDNTYSSKIIVKNSTLLNVETKVVYLNSDEELDPLAFIISDEEYEYSFVSNINEVLAEEGNVHIIQILVKDGEVEQTVDAILITSQESLFSMNCQKDTEGYLLSLIKGDRVLSNPKMKYVISTFDNAEEYLAALEMTKDEYKTIDNVNKKITVYSVVSDEQMQQDFTNTVPTSYKDLKALFKANDYEC